MRYSAAVMTAANEQMNSDRQADAASRQERYLAQLLDFLSIVSISRGAEHLPEVHRASRWVADRLTAAGLEHVQFLTGGGVSSPASAGSSAGGKATPVAPLEVGPAACPAVYGEWLHAPGKPTVLVYGHFDVQPAAPLDAWTSPPFQPEIRDGRVYGRGASDNKGTLLIPILAVETLLQTRGSLPLNVKFLLEGEEEVGSTHLVPMLASYRDLLRCDLVLCADGGRCGDDPPGLVTGTRGSCAVEVKVRGAQTDLHSGIYGGAVQNPFLALANILSALRTPDGTVLVDGFYDSVLPLSETERSMSSLPVDDETFRETLGVPSLIGESGFSLAERLGARPTLEVLRVWGDHTEEAITPIIPCVAYARISCRLVPDQQPDQIARLVAAQIGKLTPTGVTVTAKPVGRGSRAYVTPIEHPGNQAAAQVLAGVCGKEPYFSRLGGTVPVLVELRDQLSAHTVFMGFSRDDEGAHAPDEFLRVENFTRGQTAIAQWFKRLSEIAPETLRNGG